MLKITNLSSTFSTAFEGGGLDLKYCPGHHKNISDFQNFGTSSNGTEFLGE